MLDNDYIGSIDISWDEFEDTCKNIASKIACDFPNYKDIAIVGMARGGLILLGEISYLLDTKNIGIMQMTFKDKYGVYRKDNKETIIGEFVRPNVDNIIIVEDILVTGKTVLAAANRFEQMGKKVVGIYSMLTVGDFENHELEEKNIILWSDKKSDRRYWINYPWDKRIIRNEN